METFHVILNRFDQDYTLALEILERRFGRNNVRRMNPGAFFLRASIPATEILAILIFEFESQLARNILRMMNLTFEPTMTTDEWIQQLDEARRERVIWLLSEATNNPRNLTGIVIAPVDQTALVTQLNEADENWIRGNVAS